MIAFETANATVATVSQDAELSPLVSMRTTPVRPRHEVARPGRPRETGATAPDVDPHERGDEKERNQGDSAVSAVQEVHATEKAILDDGEGGRVRSEAARDLVRRVDQLLPLVEDVSLAANIQLLKRDLSRCHDLMKGRTGESDFLSIVTLVESAMAQLKWKQYTREKLEAIRQALDIGYRKVRVRFDDYEEARRLLASSGVDAAPRIDLESLKLEELEDGEEE